MKKITPNLYNGLGSAVYALIKKDGQLHLEDSLKARLVLLEQPQGAWAIHSFQLREHHQYTVEEAYRFAIECFIANRKELKPKVKRYFINIMEKIAQADNQVTGKEVEFLQKFRNDLEKI